MTINEAKELIRDTVRIYLKKNKYGEYLIPYMKQRPIYMVGAPGIGKTAIIEQIAKEFNIPVVSFSMTHLNRDNAIGVPVIRKVPFGDHYQDVAEYTVSEIIASVYHVIFDSKKDEGILFLDEINCVSDTLAPLMLLFLQYKKFGNRQLPPGWVIVTAGNPPEYNKSVQAFDLATMDRLKYISVEPNVDVWMIYARKQGIHGSISAFLESHKNMFYSVKETDIGQEYVTARGWEDLSKALQLYETLNLHISLTLIQQYITDRNISELFFRYYNVYADYEKNEYYKILFTENPKSAGIDITELPYENKLALINQLISSISNDLIEENRLSHLKEYLTTLVDTINKTYSKTRKINLDACFEQELMNLTQIIKREESGNTLPIDTKHIYMDLIEILQAWKDNYSNTRDIEPQQLLYMISMDAAKHTQYLDGLQNNITTCISNSKSFMEKYWNPAEYQFYKTGLEQLKYIDQLKSQPQKEIEEPPALQQDKSQPKKEPGNQKLFGSICRFL